MGSTGLLLRYDGARWSPMASDSDLDSEVERGGSTTDVLAVDEYGTILRYGR